MTKRVRETKRRKHKRDKKGNDDHIHGGNSDTTETSYIPPDIRGDEFPMQDGHTLKDHVVEECRKVLRVFNTKVRATPAKVPPM